MFRAIFFGIIFYTFLALYLSMMYPISWMFSAKTNFSIVFRPITKGLLFLLKHIAGVGHKIVGLEKLNEALSHGPIIVCCNHQSEWETFIFSILFDQISIIVKQELLKKPIAGTYFLRLGCLPIDRSSPVKSIKSILRYGKNSIDSGISILIFPGGTRIAYGEEEEYKSGIYAMYKSFNVPVVPAFVNSGEFWPSISNKRGKGIITLSFDEKINPGLDKKEFFNLIQK